MPQWIDELRERTHPGEQRLAATPWCTALATRALERPSYVGWLRAWEILYGAVEPLIARTSDARVRELWSEGDGRLPALQRAVEAVATRDEVPAATRAQLEAMLVAQQLRRAALVEPMTLLGALHGLQLATRVLAPSPVAVRGLDLPALELAAWTDAQGSAALVARMEAAELGTSARASILEAAVDLLERLLPVVGALHPFVSEPLGELLDQINPDAGTHPITDDLRELHVALQAGADSWDAFPYYEARYGARGWRFTNSDSAWLVTLCQLDVAHVHKQVGWLAGMLATRGMPRLMMEEHLLLLHGRLCAALPSRRARYGLLREAALVLREARVRHLAQSEQDALARSFERLARREVVHLPRTGEMLVAAVADERDGIAGAVSSLANWLTDPARFGTSWRAAVETTIEHARAAFGRSDEPDGRGNP